ncbi:SusC/RagA family TonB-linked outer membrane protein [Parabacteroides sp. HGS0025]|uniref:SusC/RagA family TonB-linked outer membrane protein n=1 Tax=Parabacteroides sp. HGS0025 TaxID=1078087 RepID=UPI0006173E31|nr:TonB-dependent receptor [Parabacteroides sp. HGS0025]KKB50049.1 SusC/RagA family TonB-linked outer membrane protein [Parabacteroides sp. HGS0025]
MSRLLDGNLPPCKKAAERKNRILSLLFFFMAFISVQVYAQDIKISGTVISGSDNYPIIGANILVKGTTIGTITDVDGNFSFEAPKGSTLVVSYIGYQSQEMQVSGNAPIKIVLSEDSEKLDEVIVIGYGSQKKSDMTGGIVAVGNEKLQMVSTNNLMDKLAGQVPGLNITMEKANPSEDQVLRVRGENSLTADNSPLIVLDGIPYSGSLGDIDPDNIENLSVLKDASSAAIYGSRGANGVILIQTKKGKKGTATVSYKGQVGFSQPERRVDVMKGPEYVKFLQDQWAYMNYNGVIKNPEDILNVSEIENWRNGIETDWQDQIFRTALTNSHQLSVSGGTEKTTYMASISRLNQEGVVKDTGMKRTNIALNITQQLGNWLTIGMATQAVQKEYGGIQAGISDALCQSPYGQPYNSDGSLNFYPMDQTLHANPLADLEATSDKTDRNIFISTYADAKLPIKGLSFRTNFGYNYRSKFEGSYYGRNTVTGKAKNGSAAIKNQHDWDYTWENVLKYELQLGKHKFDATGLFSMQQTSQEISEQKGTSFVNDDSEYHNMAGAEENKTVTSELTETAMLSYMLRLNYNYANRYLFTATGRSDGYSAFGTNNKYAFFPSLAAAWNISSEEFMESTNSWMDMLKIRLSWGSNGNQAIKAYQTLDRLKLTNYIWGDKGTTVNGVILSYNSIGNPNLKWETTRTVNAGVDFSFFNSRLSGSVDFYVSNTSDLLMSRTVPIMNGYNSIMDNVGETRNTGIELALNSVNMENKDFRWSTSYNFSLNRDKIIELRGDGKDDITNKWFIGEPVKVYYDYNVVGTWQEDDNFLNADGKEIQKGAKPGHAKLEDVDGDGTITAKDKKIIGSKLPSFTMSLGNTFTYKDFTFSFLLNGVFGAWKEMIDYNFDRWSSKYNYISGMDYWTPENPTNAMTSPGYVPYDKHSFYKKMNYVRIKNITLGYNIPKAILTPVGISALNVNLSVNNLYTFSNVKNALNFDGTDYNANIVSCYPTARSFMLGLNLIF